MNCFAGNTSVTGLHPEGTANVVVVDLSVESQGYLYVLKYFTPASGPVLASDYRLDIYNPDGTFLAQVTGLAAASLHVDLWRNVFTLNSRCCRALAAPNGQSPSGFPPPPARKQPAKDATDAMKQINRWSSAARTGSSTSGTTRTVRYTAATRPPARSSRTTATP